MRIVIDRIESDMAIVEKEDGSLVQMPKSLIPPEAKEGDILLITVDDEAGINRKQEIVSLMEEVWDGDEGIDRV